MPKIKTELIFPGRLKDEAILCGLCKKFDITLSIVEASFSTDTGWAIVVIEGAEQEIKNACAFLAQRGVQQESSSLLT